MSTHWSHPIWLGHRNKTNPRRNGVVSLETQRHCVGDFWRKKKTAYAVRNVKMRSDPRSQFWYAAIGGHFCSFLVSNIFCDPLFLLSICLPYSSHRSNTNHTFLNGEYRGFWVLLLRAERRGLYFVASAAVRCRFTAMPSVFCTVRIACSSIYSTNFTHIWSLLANQRSFELYRGILWISWPAMESTGNSDIPLGLTKWGCSSVHGTAPPSPKFQEEFCRCCSSG